MVGEHLLVVIFFRLDDVVLLSLFGLANFGIQCRSLAILLIIFLGRIEALLRPLVDQHLVDFVRGLPSLVALCPLDFVVHICLSNQLIGLVLEVLLPDVLLSFFGFCESFNILVHILDIVPSFVNLGNFLQVINDVRLFYERIRDVIGTQGARIVNWDPLHLASRTKCAKHHHRINSLLLLSILQHLF